MAKLCAADNIAMTPYSALAGGRLSKRPGETSKRLQEDSYAKLKYDSTAEQDGESIRRTAELAGRHGVTMTEIALAWLLTKVTAPVVGATKLHHIEGAAKAVDLVLTAEERAYLKEPYVPHALGGRDGTEHRLCREKAPRLEYRQAGNSVNAIPKEPGPPGTMTAGGPFLRGRGHPELRQGKRDSLSLEKFIK